ncbi:MAG: hypothetical protein ACXWC2_21575 [Ramlibacter sp.]
MVQIPLQRRAAVAALLLPLTLLARPAQAQITDEDMCRNGLFPSQDGFRVATVGGKARLYFFDDWDGCPQKGASCQQKAYVVAGDRLLLGKTHGEWTCAWYEGRKHETVGWVRNGDLRIDADAPEQADWAGKWKQYDAPGYISIVRKQDAWYVLGEARWSSDVTTHFGEMSGALQVRGRHAHLGGAPGPQNDGCIADLTRVGEFLVVHDNGQCGGVNVRFDGVYTRAR